MIGKFFATHSVHRVGMQYSQPKCSSTADVSNYNDRKTKPSSPREFFERIYGDADDKISHSCYSIVEHLFIAKKNRIGEIEWRANCHPTDDKYWRDKFLLGPNVEASTTPLNVTRPTTIQSFSHGLSVFLERKKRKGGKLRRQRTIFSNKQTKQLDNEFRINEYIPRNRRQELAERLQLTEMQIKIWFQNRRAKDKRLEKAQLDQQYRSLIAAQVISVPFRAI